jgi:hypothetical protein
MNFGQYVGSKKLNEQAENKLDFNHPILWIQSLKGEIQWMTITNAGNITTLENALPHIEEQPWDTVTIVDIASGLGNGQCDIFAGGNRPSSTNPNDLYVEGTNVIKTITREDMGFDESSEEI